MTFNILLIDDDLDKRDELDSAIEKIELTRISHLTELLDDQKLAESIGSRAYRLTYIDDYKNIVVDTDNIETDAHRDARTYILEADLVIADVIFDGLNQLESIVQRVERIRRNAGLSVLPIIAWTVLPGEALDVLHGALGKDGLIEILDKNTGHAEYLGWRIERLSNQVQQVNPALSLQKLLLEMDDANTPSWHDHVLSQVHCYRNSANEHEVMYTLEKPITAIGTALGVDDIPYRHWKMILEKWEMIERAAIPSVRGHVRHVINVYWMGYYLLNHPFLQDVFTSPDYLNCRRCRSLFSEIEKEDFLSFLNASWFLAGLFHDIGNYVQKTNDIVRELQSIFNTGADPFEIEITYHRALDSQNVIESFTDLKLMFDRSAGDAIRTIWNKGLQKEQSEPEPDSGICGALLILSSYKNTILERQARVAAEAICIHNLIGDADFSDGMISWSEHPLICLLLLCDQLQTWDRERGDENPTKTFFPWQAEILSLNVSKDSNSSRPHIFIAINYITSPIVRSSVDLLNEVRTDLENVLLRRPSAALRKISRPSPLKITVQFSLNLKPIETAIILD